VDPLLLADPLLLEGPEEEEEDPEEDEGGLKREEVDGLLDALGELDLETGFGRGTLEAESDDSVEEVDEEDAFPRGLEGGTATAFEEGLFVSALGLLDRAGDLLREPDGEEGTAGVSLEEEVSFVEEEEEEEEETKRGLLDRAGDLSDFRLVVMGVVSGTGGFGIDEEPFS